MVKFISYIVITLLAVLPSLSTPTFAQALRLLENCTPPVGVVFEFGIRNDIHGNRLQSEEDGFVMADDGFAGMSPSFAFDGTRFYVRWGSLKVPGVNVPEPAWEEAIVVQVTANRVTAIEPYGERGIWMHTVFWRNASVFSSRHSEFISTLDPTGYVTDGAIYHMTCDPR
ncbi:hypothetical protein [Roseinatronobacter bogoriensis]|uniref:hypothetical protein n=1 Tax=Roseinatronobacter bogoriensis TaxID=119542 RepID=UPI001E64C9F5|nr:hypothetical protein [Rhodobaca barguzinensis]